MAVNSYYNETDSNLGSLTIQDSEVNITAFLDGIEAISSMTLTNNKIHIVTGNGSSNTSTKSDWGDFGNNDDEASAKGIKCDGTITIQNGEFEIDSSDDAIHSNQNIEIQAGNFSISSGDDGIHADDTLTIEDGTVEIKKSYEGLEASNIYLKGGKINITSSDDGINSSGGADQSSMNRPGANTFASDGSKIEITDGYIVVNANGDGIDSNGDISMTGGTLIIEGPTDNGNGAIDYNGTYNISGGILIAIGSSGMDEAPSNSSTQPIMKLSLENQKANSVFQIKEKNGNEIITFSPSKTYSSIVYSSPDLKLNQSYEIYLGKTIEEGENGIISETNFQNGTLLTTLTLDNIVTTYGNSKMFGEMAPGFRPMR